MRARCGIALTMALMVEMIANGQTGNKGGKGFYLAQESGAKQVLDFNSGEYVDFPRPHIGIALQAEQEGVKCLLDDDSEYGRYAWIPHWSNFIPRRMRWTVSRCTFWKMR